MTPVACPLCGNAISAEKIIGTTAICSCGWHGRIDYENVQKSKRRTQIVLRILTVFFIAATVYCVYEWSQWGRFFSNRVVLQVKNMLGLDTISDWGTMGAICNTFGRFECSKKAFNKVLKYEPDSLIAKANIAMAETRLGEHENAIRRYEELFEKGETAPDAMAYYGVSLESVGKLEEAESWYYRALSIQPGYIDITEKLINLLVKKKAYSEALSVIGNLSAFYPDAEKYFKAHAIHISELNQKTTPVKTIKLSSFRGHHFLPLQFGDKKESHFFVIDTGATALTTSYQFLADENIDFKELEAVPLRFADGGSQMGTRILIEKIKIGPWELKNVQATVCDNCMNLAGKSLLQQFEMRSYTKDGVEFLLLRK